MTPINDENDQPTPQRTFSVAFLFRAMSLTAFFISWPLSIATSPPEIVAATLIGIGSVLAVIVGYRRHGPILVRIGVTIGFLVGVLGIAVYSGGLAYILKERTLGAGVVLAEVVYGLTLPVTLGIMVLLLRAWCWSANDRLVYDSDIPTKDGC